MGDHPLDPEGRMIPDASWPPGRTAPGRLERVRRFVNTFNRESGADHFGEPQRAAQWLAGDGWALEPSADELVELRRFRADLHGAIARRPRAGSTWPAAMADVRLGVAADADGRGAGGDGATGRADRLRARRDHRRSRAGGDAGPAAHVHQRALPVVVLRPIEERWRAVVRDVGVRSAPEDAPLPGAPAGRCRPLISPLRRSRCRTGGVRRRT